MKDKFEIICQRDLILDESNDSQISVRLGIPVKFKSNEFVCAFQIIGMNNSQIQYAHGEDCFQALILALEGIRVTLDKSGKVFTWIGGEQGDYGFPRFIPMSFGLSFSKALDNIIDQEIERFIENIPKK